MAIFQRNIYLVDPLPNIAKSVRAVLEGVSDSQLQVRYIAVPEGYDVLLRKLRTDLKLGYAVGLVAPVNETGKHPVLDSFRQQSEQPKARIFDMLTAIRQHCQQVKADVQLPVVMPFLFEFRIPAVEKAVMEQEGLQQVLACLVNHINGVDKTYRRQEIMAAFRRHLHQPEQENYMMKDYIPAFIRSLKTA